VEAPRSIARIAITCLTTAVAVLFLAAATEYTDAAWTGNVAENAVTVEGQERSGVRQVGNAPGGSDQDNGGQAASGPLIQSRWVPDCHDSSPH
jgi:hypothetical protein